jgi:L-ribulose-5-phosphate 3-epimerase UlaE
VLSNERMTLSGWALRSRYERAKLWLESRRVRDPARGREAMQAVVALARELGMRPIEQAAVQCLSHHASESTGLAV